MGRVVSFLSILRGVSMIYGLYVSGHGADLQAQKLDTIANNMANASSSGFKPDRAVIQEAFPFERLHGSGRVRPEELEQMSGGAFHFGTATDFTLGTPIRTDNPLDITLQQPNQFLRVRVGNEERLTRDGQLHVNHGGQLATKTGGYLVLDSAGQPITVPLGTYNVTSRGAVLEADGAAVARLGIAEVPDLRSVAKLGGNLLTSTGPVNTDLAPGQIAVQSGAYESSGVNPTVEMLEMIKTSRNAEANVNMLRLQEQTLDGLLSLARR